MKKVAFLLCLVMCIVIFAGCNGNTDSPEITNTTAREYLPPVTYSETGTTAYSVIVTEQAPTAQAENTTTESTTAPVTVTEPVIILPQTTVPNITESESTSVKELKKTGEMEFSDSKDNKYVKAIADKYSVDPQLLAAIYTVPDNDGNIVLQFDGSKDGNGKLIRTEDTLVAIYSIKKDFTSKRASRDDALNEYPSGERTVMFMYTTKYIMPKFETDLRG